jgi:SAM-dependent methyltransferase
MKQSFYRRIRAQGYDIGTDQTEIINFYLEMWQQLGTPTPLLEPMSGTGINLIPFLEAGADIDGLDSSPFMLEICRQKCEAKGLRCNLYEQYIEQMELPRHYGFIFIPGGTYGHIHDKVVAAECLKRVYDHLLPGGWLGLDVRTPAYMVNFPKSGEADFGLGERPDGATIFTTGIWQHLDKGKVIRNWAKFERFVDDILVETEVFDYRERLYDLHEMVAELRATGFDEIHMYKGWTHDIEPGDHYEISFFCRKA